MRSTRFSWGFKFLVVLFVAQIECKRMENTKWPVRTRPTPYKMKVIDRTCLLQHDEGPCRAHLRMWFFHPEEMACKMFTWGGCQGNGNRFETQEQCMDSCVSKKNAIENKRPPYCSLSFDYGYCFGHLQRWHYNKLMHVCEERVYSGCGGNKNNFYTKEQCNNICLFQSGPLTAPPINKDNETMLIVNIKTRFPMTTVMTTTETTTTTKKH